MFSPQFQNENANEINNKHKISALITELINNNSDNNYEILIKREPLVYNRARRAVQRKKKEKK